MIVFNELKSSKNNNFYYWFLLNYFETHSVTFFNFGLY